MIVFECDGKDCDAHAPAIMNRYGSGEAQIPAGWAKVQWMKKVEKLKLPDVNPIIASGMLPPEKLQRIKKIAKAHEIAGEIENIGRFDIEIRIVILCEVCLEKLEGARYHEIGRIEATSPRPIVRDGTVGDDLAGEEEVASMPQGNPKSGDLVCPKCKTMISPDHFPPNYDPKCIVCGGPMQVFHVS